MRDAFFQKLERHVVGLFDEVRQKANAAGEEFCRTPYTEELFSVRCESLFFEQMVCRALAARELFRETAPHWSPELPLNAAEWEKMISGKSNEIAVVGYFGRSWACANWGPHPTFRDYVCGLMACEFTPSHIRDDSELRKEYPPRELPGLDQSPRRKMDAGSDRATYEGRAGSEDAGFFGSDLTFGQDVLAKTRQC